jgi:hypothetical protein
MYEDVLAVVEPGRELYLAIPEEAERSIFGEEIGRLMLERRIRRMVRFSVADQEIVRIVPSALRAG